MHNGSVTRLVEFRRRWWRQRSPPVIGAVPVSVFGSAPNSACAVMWLSFLGMAPVIWVGGAIGKVIGVVVGVSGALPVIGSVPGSVLGSAPWLSL